LECSLAIRIFFERQHKLYQLGTICVSLERRVYGELGVGAIMSGADQTPLYRCQVHFIKAWPTAGHLIGSTIILVLLSDSTGLNPLRANILHSWPLFAVSACSSPDQTRKQLLLLPQGPSPIHCSHHINTKLPTVCLRASTKITYDLQNDLQDALTATHCALIISIQLATSPHHQVLGCYNSAQSQLN
jgi:hypothetical protein